MNSARDHRGDPTATPLPLTARSAAARLGVDERTIRRAIARGDLRAVKRAGAFQISLTDLDEYRSGGSRPFRATAADHGTEQDATNAQGMRGTLPAPLTSLVGRDHEIATLTAALRGRERLFTLTGPGGVGKTRLAVAAASAVTDDFHDGVRYISLDQISDPGLVAQSIAHALGVRESGGEPIEHRLAVTLSDQRLLLVIDNFEQVVEAAPLLSVLLGGCPHLKILVTSRVRLRISGEHERAVPPLGLVAPKDSGTRYDNVQSDAVRLFVERAHAVRDSAGFTAEHMGAVEAICQRLDGLPLAIELAAARVNALSPVDMLIHLERLLPLLTSGPRDAPARLQTMRDAIAWSYDLLTGDEQALFRRLAIFVGGFTLDGLSAISYRLSATEVSKPASRQVGELKAGGRSVTRYPSPVTDHPPTPPERSDSPFPPFSPSSTSTFDLIAALVDKSLLRAEPVGGGATRYSMLGTIREFGLEQLTDSGEADAIRQRHAGWYLAFAEDAGPRAKQAGAAAWLPRLEAEHPNLRAALTWYLGQGDGYSLMRMAASLWPFWQEHAHAGEGYHWLEQALDLGRDAPAADRLRALAGAGTLAWYLTRVAQAQEWHEQALVLAQEAGDPAAEAFALCNISWQMAERGDLDGAAAACESSIALASAAGATETMGLALHNLACFTRMQGDLEAASRHAAAALAMAREEGWDWLAPMILVGFGYTALALGDADRAAALLREGLELGLARGDLVDVSTALEGLARVAVAGQAARAARLFGVAAALRDNIGMPQSPTERSYFAPILAALRDDLGAESFAAAWAAGQSLPREDAIAEALAPSAIPYEPSPSSTAAAWRQLTVRELEILHLLASGLRNREIAERLFITPTTVASHIASIYGKIGVSTRAQATAFAHQHDLA